MKIRRLLLASLTLAAVSVGPVAAEVFTITLTNGAEFITRYQPKQDPRDEGKMALLTEFGNWIALTKEMVATVTSETESRGFGTVLDTNTIDIGWAPNDRPEETGEASDPTSRFLEYLSGGGREEQDFSVEQFVTTEGAGTGGLPASGVTSSGSSSFPFGGGGTGAVDPASDQ